MVTRECFALCYVLSLSMCVFLVATLRHIFLICVVLAWTATINSSGLLAHPDPTTARQIFLGRKEGKEELVENNQNDYWHTFVAAD